MRRFMQRAKKRAELSMSRVNESFSRIKSSDAKRGSSFPFLSFPLFLESITAGSSFERHAGRARSDGAVVPLNVASC